MRHLIHRFLWAIPATVIAIGGIFLTAAGIWPDIRAQVDQVWRWAAEMMNSPLFWIGLITVVVGYAWLLFITRDRRTNISPIEADQRLATQMITLAKGLFHALDHAPAWASPEDILTSKWEREIDEVVEALKVRSIPTGQSIRALRVNQIADFMQKVGLALEQGGLANARRIARQELRSA